MAQTAPSGPRSYFQEIQRFDKQRHGLSKENYLYNYLEKFEPDLIVKSPDIFVLRY